LGSPLSLTFATKFVRRSPPLCGGSEKDFTSKVFFGLSEKCP
jgi:hypothetical protein